MFRTQLLKIQHALITTSLRVAELGVRIWTWLRLHLAPVGRLCIKTFPNWSYVPAMLCVPLGLIAVIILPLAISLKWFHYIPILRAHTVLLAAFSMNALPAPAIALLTSCYVGTAVLLACCIVGLLVRKEYALSIIRKGYIATYLLFAVYVWAVFSLTAQIQDSSSIEEVAGLKVDAVVIFFWRYNYLWFAAFVTTFVSFLHVFSWRRCVINLYTGSDKDEPAFGDHFFENWRTHGRHPDLRKSTWGSVWTHVMIIIVIPFLLELIGCVPPYRPPFGGGNPVVQMVRVVKPKKKKKRKNYILRSDSAIYFQIPDLDESKIMEEVEEESQLTYVADPNAVHGNLGDGAAGIPGWQDGFKDGIVRFIRLEYAGPDWDDGMDAQSRADMNFLDKFRKMSGGMKTARHSESHPVRMLKKYPKGQAPPFVYMTGSGAINMGSKDVEILRKFLLEGSMLFADCGSPRWDSSFRSLARQLFPGNSLRVISDDDPIFQIPFTFAHGAPPLWHHGGQNVMGIRVKNRWVVFYHPGDINDAWKTGHSGIEPELAEKAYQTGVNVVYYSFMRYFEATKKYRK